MALNRGILETIKSRVMTRMELPFARALPTALPDQIVFIIGCGRSGTTVFGECLACHSQVTYLHEPRALWQKAFPQTDIWSPKAESRGGRLVLTAQDAQRASSGADVLKRLFGFQVWKSGRPILVEKLPINNFRAAFLHQLFPQAKFIHLVRDPREVARSIAQRADNRHNGWYGHRDYKWRLLAQLAQARGYIEVPGADCDDNYARGLLEWRLSVEAFEKFEQTAPAGSTLQICYNDLIQQPVETIHSVLSFLGAAPSIRLDRYIQRTIRRRTAKFANIDLTERESALCGAAFQRYRDCLHSHPVKPSRRCDVAHLLRSGRSPDQDESANSTTTGASQASSKNVTPRVLLGRAFARMRRLLVGLGVAYALGPHMGIVRLLGPQRGFSYARAVAHLHWLGTWFGAQRQTARTLERLRPQFTTNASTSEILRRHLVLKHQSFVEWRISNSQAGQEYTAAAYHDLPESLTQSIKQYQAEGRGIMFATYHYGMYKVLANAMVQRYDVPIYKANYLSAHYSRTAVGPIARWAFRNAIATDQASNTRNIYLRPDSPPIALVKRLRRGKIVGIAADGMISQEFMDVPIFGGTMRLPSGWARLAAATRCIVIVVLASFEGHVRSISASQPFEVENTDVGIRRAVQHSTQFLERQVKARPWDWHIWHRIEFEQNKDNSPRLVAKPMILDPARFHYEKTPL